MPQSLTKNYIHIVFSTKGRRNLLPKSHLSEIHAYVKGILDNKKCPSICVGGIENHIHILCVLSRTETLSNLVRDVKSGSSLWLNSKIQNFGWQDGYGAFSVSQSQVDTVINYINNQEMHHKGMTFEQEYRKFLDAYGIHYDQAYMWG